MSLSCITRHISREIERNIPNWSGKCGKKGEFSENSVFIQFKQSLNQENAILATKGRLIYNR